MTKFDVSPGLGLLADAGFALPDDVRRDGASTLATGRQTGGGGEGRGMESPLVMQGAHQGPKKKERKCT